MTITIQQALRPLLITWFIIGVGVYPLKQPRPYLSILYTLTIWFVYGCIVYYMVISFTVEILYRSIVTKIVVCFNMFTTVMSLIIGLYHDKTFKMCMKKLAVVDDTLEELGTPKIYKKIYMWSKRVIIMWIMYIFVLNSIDAIWWTNHEEISYWGFILPYILNYNYHVNLFVDLLFIIFIWYTGNRFDKVNEHLRCLLVKEEHELRCTWKKPAVTIHRYILHTDNYKRILWISMHLHLELCRIARELNMLFGKQITLAMLLYFFCIISYCYYIYVMAMLNQKLLKRGWFGLSIWSSVFVARLYCINYICDRVSIKANEINKIIHQLTNIVRYDDVCKEIYQFALHTIHRPLKFTGMGFFYFGNEFLRKFFMSITTYVIIIIQTKVYPIKNTVSQESASRTQEGITALVLYNTEFNVGRMHQD